MRSSRIFIGSVEEPPQPTLAPNKVSHAPTISASSLNQFQQNTPFLSNVTASNITTSSIDPEVDMDY